MRKFLMAAVALICMTAVSGVFTSCEKETTEIKNVRVYYKIDTNKLFCAEGYEETAVKFYTELNNVLLSFKNEEVDEAVLVQSLQEVIDKYDNFCFKGDIELQRSFDGTTFFRVKTYTMTAQGEEE